LKTEKKEEDKEEDNEEKLGTHFNVIQRVRQQNRPAGPNGLVGLVLGDGD